MIIQNDFAVTINYKVTNTEGELIDSSEVSGPLTYLHGHRNIIPGLEQALNGKTVGDAIETEVAPADAYGDLNDDLVQRVPKAAFEGVEDIQEGMRFQAQTEQGPVSVVVTAVEDDVIVVDGNHPLAGVTLLFTAEVTGVREATAEELTHGHIHSEGGCGH